jgi:hypothetical protein
LADKRLRKKTLPDRGRSQQPGIRSFAAAKAAKTDVKLPEPVRRTSIMLRRYFTACHSLSATYQQAEILDSSRSDKRLPRTNSQRKEVAGSAACRPQLARGRVLAAGSDEERA